MCLLITCDLSFMLHRFCFWKVAFLLSPGISGRCNSKGDIMKEWSINSLQVFVIRKMLRLHNRTNSCCPCNRYVMYALHCGGHKIPRRYLALSRLGDEKMQKTRWQQQIANSTSYKSHTTIDVPQPALSSSTQSVWAVSESRIMSSEPRQARIRSGELPSVGGIYEPPGYSCCPTAGERRLSDKLANALLEAPAEGHQYIRQGILCHIFV